MNQPPECHGRVIVLDDHLMFAQVVVIALKNHGFDATSLDLGDADEPTTLVSKVLDDPPDVLLLDLDLGTHGDGGQLIEPAVRAGVEVVVMTGDPGHDDAVRALETGARFVIPKTAPLADLIAALERLPPRDPLLPAPV
jgi:two-component system nitrate/nitrite response regulator NarL